MSSGPALPSNEVTNRPRPIGAAMVITPRFAPATSPAGERDLAFHLDATVVGLLRRHALARDLVDRHVTISGTFGTLVVHGDLVERHLVEDIARLSLTTLTMSPIAVQPIAVESVMSPRVEPLDVVLWSLTATLSKGRLAAAIPPDVPLRLRIPVDVEHLDRIPGDRWMADAMLNDALSPREVAERHDDARMANTFISAAWACSLFDVDPDPTGPSASPTAPSTSATTPQLMGAASSDNIASPPPEFDALDAPPPVQFGVRRRRWRRDRTAAEG